MSGVVRDLDLAYSRLESMTRVIADRDLDTAVAGGWTVRAVLGHIAAWHDASTYRLYRFGATGREQDVISEDMDGFNAQVASEVSDRTAAQLKHAISRSYLRLRDAYEEAATASEGVEWATEMVLGNTVHHYEEHAGDLAVTAAR